MVIGVVDGYEKKLEIKGVGFRAVLEGDLLDLALGYSHPIKVKIPEGITVKVDQNTKISVSGADKHMVGEKSLQRSIPISQPSLTRARVST